MATINGTTSDDNLQDNADGDVVNGLDGNDHVTLTHKSSADGGAGDDGISVDLSDATTPIVWNLNTNTYSGPDSRYFTNFEYFSPTANGQPYFGLKTGSGDDVIVTSTKAFQDLVATGAGNDTITTYGGDSIDGGTGFDTLVIDIRVPTYNDHGTYPYNPFTPSPDGEGGIDGNYYGVVGFASIERFIIYGGALGDTWFTYNGDDQIYGGSGNETIYAGAGANIVDGGDGFDTISADLSAVTTPIVWNLQTGFYSGPGSYTNLEKFGSGSSYYGSNFPVSSSGGLFTGSGDDVITAAALPAVLPDGVSSIQTVSTGAGNDIVTVGTGTTNAFLGTGTDTLVVDYSAATTTVTSRAVNGAIGAPTDNGDGSFDGQFRFTGTTDVRTGRVNFSGVEKFDVRTGSGNDSIVTGSGDDLISTGAGNDTISAAGGNDRIDPGVGTDIANGGAGTDRLVLDYHTATTAIITIAAPAANTADGGFDGHYGDGTAAFDVTYTSIEAFTITTGSGADSITTASGNDIIDGGTGADTMTGGAGDDVYYVDNAGDVVREVTGGGTDEVRTTLATYRLGLTTTGTNAATNFVENLTGLLDTGQTLSGNNLANVIRAGAGDDTLNGGSGNDTLYGNAGNDTLAGGPGNDTMYGGTGNDTYVGVELGDTVVENAGEGIDTIQTEEFVFSLAGIANVENLSNDALYVNVSLTGNALDNVISTTTTAYGNVVDGVTYGNDRIDGGAGNDTMIGGVGNDTYVVDSLGDVVVENPDEGTDTIETALAVYTLATANVENLTGTNAAGQRLTGDANANVVTGAAGNDVIDGGGGADTLVGGLGDDTYIVGNAGVTITEAANAGTDTVRESLASYTLGANLENLVGTSPNGQALTGNELANAITGGDGNDVIDGGTGADTMTGGKGDDTYVVDNAGDVVTEAAGEGVDTVRTSLASYTLAANVENLTGTTPNSQALTGNALANVITGNAGNDTLVGGAGNDTLIGGAGNNILDGGADIDTIDYSGATGGVAVSLADGVALANGFGGDDTIRNVENVTGSGFADVIFGDAGANTLAGGGGNDVLAGGAGDDVIDGGAGTDTAGYVTGIATTGMLQRTATAGVYTFNSAAGGGQEGVDTLKNVETIIFDYNGNGMLDAGDRSFTVVNGNVQVQVAADAGSATEAGGTANGTAGTSATGNVLANDVNLDQSVAAGDVMTVVSAAWTGATGPGAGSGTTTTTTVTAGGVQIAGRYGTLTIAADGSYSYATDAAKADLLGRNTTATETFTYTANDGTVPAATTLTITVHGANDAPVAVNVSTAGSEDAATIAGTLSATDVDQGDTLTFALVAGSVKIDGVAAADGTVTVNADGSYSYAPTAGDQALALGETKVITFGYVANDGLLDSAQRTATITVNGANDAPAGAADTAATDQNTAVTIDVLANDTDVDHNHVLTATSVVVPAGMGSAAIVDGKLVYTPGSGLAHLKQGAHQDVTLTYVVQDDHGATSAATNVTVTVTGVNDAPTTTADSATTDEDTAVSVDVLTNDGDVDDDHVLTIASATVAQGQGSVAIVDGKIAFNPAGAFDTLAAGATAQVPVTYTIQDEYGAAKMGTLTVTVTGVDDPGIARADAVATDEATVLTGSVFANNGSGADSDVDGPLSVAAVNGVAASVGQTVALQSGATVTLQANGQFRYDPNHAFDYLVGDQGADNSSKTDSFTYTLTGGGTATVIVTITGITGAGDHALGTSGDDTIAGTGANDYFDLSQGGNDTASGGVGDDAFYLGAALTAADRIDGGAGTNDQVGLQGDYIGANRLVLGAQTLQNVEVIAFLSGGATPHSYDVTSNDATVTAGQVLKVFGTNLAAGENLTFNGAAETDGSFLMFGGLGIDTLTGGAQADGFYFGPERFGPNDVVHGGGGMDQLGLDGHTAALTLDATHVDVEVLALLNGPAGSPDSYGTITVDDSWVAAGQTKIITAVTSFGNSVGPVSTALVIDGHNETNGNLTIYAGSGNDTITGGAGNDRILGGLGADTLTGGAGADTFLYNSAADSTGTGFDTLVDFSYSQDKLSIAGQGTDVYTTVTTGQLNQATFDADLQAAVGSQLSAGHAVFFTASTGDYAGQTFLVVDANGTAGYQMGGDYVFHMAAAPAVPAGAADFIIA